MFTANLFTYPHPLSMAVYKFLLDKDSALKSFNNFILNFSFLKNFSESFINFNQLCHAISENHIIFNIFLLFISISASCPPWHKAQTLHCQP